MISPLNTLHGWYEKFERPISSLSLVGGFIFDAVTLKRVDLFWENLWVGVHLATAALGIIALNYFERKHGSRDFSAGQSKIHFWLLIFIQFCFGGLFSTFLVFYFRSATLATAWPFMLLLAAVFILNESFKKHYSRLIFQTSVFFVAVFAFAIYIVPVIVNKIGPLVFILSGISSLVILGIFLTILRLFNKEYFKGKRVALYTTITSIFVIINVFYFYNLIPPLPLSLKDAGVFHSLSKNLSGNYEVSFENRTYRQKVIDFLRSYQIVHIVSSGDVYIYGAVFSPENFGLQIIHQWQYYSESQGRWVDRDRVVLPILGGRDGGYRAYSLKTAPEAGLWRVRIETQNGQEIGRVKFKIEIVDSEVPLLTGEK